MNRSSADIQKSLFNILESKIQGIYYPNLQVIGAMNYGPGYNSELEFDDEAFIRRTCVLKYSPTKKDVIKFVEAKGYQDFIIEIIKKKDIVFKEYSKKDEPGWEFEQTTNLGSWHSWNQRLNNLHKQLVREKVMPADSTKNDLSIDVVLADFIQSGKYYFNEFMLQQIQGVLQQIKTLSTVDIENDILKTGSIPEKLKENREDVYLKTVSFLTKNPDLVIKYVQEIIKLYSKSTEYIVQLFKGLNEESKRTEDADKKKIFKKSKDIVVNELPEELTDVLADILA